MKNKRYQIKNDARINPVNTEIKHGNYEISSGKWRVSENKSKEYVDPEINYWNNYAMRQNYSGINKKKPRKNIINKLGRIGFTAMTVLALVGAPNFLIYSSAKEHIDAQPTNAWKLEEAYNAMNTVQESGPVERMFTFGAYLAGKEAVKKYGGKNDN